MKPLSKDEGVSEVFGYILILGIVVTGLGIVMLVILPSIQHTKDDSQVKNVQQGFTVVDSRLSKARYSTSIFQEAPIQVDNGAVSVDDGTNPDGTANSYIKVDEYKESPPDSGTYVYEANLYRGYLGTIRCVTDKGEVGYQDGGVFTLYDKGLPTEHSVMVSPPDFDYNGVTLTLPIMHMSPPAGSVSGTYSVAGKDTTMLIQSKSTGTVNLRYPTGTETNPLDNDKMIVISVTSDYYESWYQYFKELGLNPQDLDANARSTRTTTVKLSSGHGWDHMSYDNNFDTAHMLKSATPNNPIQIFSFNLDPDNTGNAYHAIYHTQDGVWPQLTIDVGGSTAQANMGYAEVTITYQHDGPNQNDMEEFKGLIPFQRKNNGDLSIDLLNNVSTVPPGNYYAEGSEMIPEGALMYDAPSSSYSFGSTWNQPDAGQEISYGKTMSAQDVIQHYMWIMANKAPAYQTTWPTYYVDSNSRALTDNSVFTLQYKSDEQIKYLYISDATLETGVSNKG